MDDKTTQLVGQMTIFMMELERNVELEKINSRILYNKIDFDQDKH